MPVSLYPALAQTLAMSPPKRANTPDRADKQHADNQRQRNENTCFHMLTVGPTERLCPYRQWKKYVAKRSKWEHKVIICSIAPHHRVQELATYKGYDNQALREWLDKRGIRTVVPPRCNRKLRFNHGLQRIVEV